MYLAGIQVTTIQLLGRWKALMRYISREQVDCLTEDVSSKMLTVQPFYTSIPNVSTDKTLANDSSTPKCSPNLMTAFRTLVL
jgi:hypothetical protein